MLTPWEKEREALMKEAAGYHTEACEILAAEGQKVASSSEPDLVETLKQASLVRIYADLKYVEYANVLLGVTA
jgi:hypothetical protein